MVPGVLKLYSFVTGLYALIFIYGIAESFGALMYTPDYRYISELEHQAQPYFNNHPRGLSVTRNVGS